MVKDSNTPALDALADAKKGGSVAAALMQIADTLDVFRDANRGLYTIITHNGAPDVVGLSSKQVSLWLRAKVWEQRQQAPGSDALVNAIALLEYRASNSSNVKPVWVRIAEHNGDTWLDLGDDSRAAVRIAPDGWEIVAVPPVMFRRPASQAALPRPVKGGSLDELRSYINTPDENTWALVKVWLVAAMQPRGPYPILCLSGEQGSAKTTTARVLLRLVDPATPDLRHAPRDVRDLMIAANNSWALGLDNVSCLSQWESDALCSLSTGSGYATRALYTDTDEVIFALERPLLLNGITDYVDRPDLLDRALPLTLPAISDVMRRDEAALWAAFAMAQPRILGALLDRVTGALRERLAVSLPSKPRMADFAILAVAAEQAAAEAPRFLRAYAGLREATNDQAIEGSPIGLPLMRLSFPWEGTAAELLEELARLDEQATKKRHWPNSPTAMGGELRRLQPALRALGYDVTRSRGGHTRKRIIRIDKVASPASASSAPETHDGAQHLVPGLSLSSATAVGATPGPTTDPALVNQQEQGCTPGGVDIPDDQAAARGMAEPGDTAPDTDASDDWWKE